MTDKTDHLFNSIQLLLHEGCAVEIGRLCICRLIRPIYDDMWQVHCDDYNEQFSELFNDEIKAISKFILTKKKLYDKNDSRCK